MKDWTKEFSAAITVCDRNGIVISMNDKAIATFEKEGGAKLIGTCIRDVHKPETWQKILNIMESGIPNTYTIEKNGVKKLIDQRVWHQNGEIAGLVEISIEIPMEMAHHVRT